MVHRDRQDDLKSSWIGIHEAEKSLCGTSLIWKLLYSFLGGGIV
jgi:hypothetical protein